MGKVTSAAKELECSPAFVHSKMKEARLSLRDVLKGLEGKAKEGPGPGMPPLG